MRILIVEDEPRLCDALLEIMKEQKFVADAVHDGQEALYYAMNAQYDVIVLDVMLPKMNGFEVVKQMRRAKNDTPVLLLTARDEVSDKVRGLDCGADDYMTKPFAPEELLARMRAVSRRQGGVVIEEMEAFDIKLDLSSGDISCGAKSVHLGHKEFEVLKLLMSTKRGVVSKDELLERVWGAESDAADNNVEAYISFLRKKLFYLGSKVNIAALRKLGYRLEVEADDKNA